MHFHFRPRVSFLALVAGFAISGCKPVKQAAPPQPVITNPSTPAVAGESTSSAEPVSVERFGLTPSVKSVKSDTAGAFEITYEWKVSKKREQDWRVFVHFTYPDGGIAFQNDHQAEPATSQWEPGEIQQGPFTVGIPEGTAGTFDIRMGLFQTEGAEAGGSARDELDGNDDGEKRYLVGRLVIADGRADFKSAE